MKVAMYMPDLGVNGRRALLLVIRDTALLQQIVTSGLASSLDRCSL